MSQMMPGPPTQEGATETHSLWNDLKRALRGSEEDYTKIPLNRAILLLAIPMVLELVMESTFAMVDIYFVAQLGPSAVATVGLTETYLFFFYSVAIGLTMAVTAVIARRVGEGQREEAGKAAFQSILLGIFSSIPFAVAGIFFAKDLLLLMGADDWAVNHGYRYTQWMLGGNAVIMLLFILNGVFRGAGDAAAAMRVLAVANGINIILDPVLIFGWGPVRPLGIEGAAVATNIGRGIGVLMQVWILVRGSRHIRMLRENIRLNFSVMWTIMKTSFGGIGQMIVGMASWMFLMRILAEVGSTAVAGATITMRIMMFTTMPAMGLSNAAATLVGQNLGAGHPERAESSVWKIGFYNMGYLLAISALFFFLPHELIGFFSSDAEVISVGAEWLRILSYSFFVYGWWMVSSQAFNGAGDTRTPTYINLVFFWLIQIPLSWFLAVRLGWQESGVFWGVFISETSVGLFTLWLFTKGKWKTHKV